MNIELPSHLSDNDLVAAVGRLATSKRAATASLIAHLAELFARRLHERAGFSSLFTYCTTVLRLSEHEAYDRMKAAKVVRRYPAVLELLAAGKVNLTTVRLLAPHLTRQNHAELFAAACGQGKRKLQELLASRFPRPDVATSVRRLPVPKIEPAPLAGGPIGNPVTPGPGHAHEDARGTAGVSAASMASAPIPAAPPPLVTPLAPDRYRVTFTADAQTRELLELAQDLLRHANPSGDPAQIVARALNVLVEDLVRKKFAATPRPRAGRDRAKESRYIPAEVKRTVYIRDRGRCTFVGAHARRCCERAFVEFDHHPVPYGAGGRATVDNIQLRCRAHNNYLAEQFYGSGQRRGGAAGLEVITEARARVSGDAFLFRNDRPPGVPCHRE